jgi:hypothetical protein
MADYQREVEELHTFFQRWLHGELANTDAAFARVTGVLAPSFVLITPDGKLTTHDPLLAGIRAGHGARRDLNMWVQAVQQRQQINDILIVTYEEWQAEAGRTTARLSTAVFQTDASTPHGLRWSHVHETWLPGHHKS